MNKIILFLCQFLLLVDCNHPAEIKSQFIKTKYPRWKIRAKIHFAKDGDFSYKRKTLMTFS